MSPKMLNAGRTTVTILLVKLVTLDSNPPKFAKANSGMNKAVPITPKHRNANQIF